MSFGGMPEFEARPGALEAGWPTSYRLRGKPAPASAPSLLCSRSMAGRQGRHGLDLTVPPHRDLASGEVTGVVVCLFCVTRTFRVPLLDGSLQESVRERTLLAA